MDEQLAARASGRLREILAGRFVRETETLLREVDLEIAAGKRLVKDVSVSDDVDPETPSASPRRVRTAFVGSQPFTENEKLEILVDAVRLVLVAPGRMVARLRHEVAQAGGPGAQDVVFLGEADEAGGVKAGAFEVRQELDAVLHQIMKLLDTDQARARRAKEAASDSND